MPSIIKVDQIQSDTGNMILPASNVAIISANSAGNPALLIYGDKNSERIHVRSTSSGSGSGQPVVALYSSRGTNPSQSGDPLGYYQFGALDNGGNWVRNSWIQGYASENITTTARGGGMIFGTTPNGSTTLTDRVRITENGVLDVLTGQIKFPATQNASTDPNTLDDYEEGDWTPAWGSSGSIPSNSPSTQVGKYVKIGRVVHFWGRLFMNSWGSGGSGNIRVTGLPFTVEDLGGGSNGGSLCHVVWTRSGGNVTWPTNSTQILGRLLPSSTSIEYISMGNADGLGESGPVQWTSNPGMFNNYFAGSYYTAG